MAQPIKNFIRASQGSLADILKRANFLADLNAKILRHLKPEFAPHCCVASLNEDLLRIAVDSSTFACSLQYEIPILLQQFSMDKSLPPINAIDFYVDARWQKR
jgi:hypothetical protein